ncbi:MAG TPA: hypothetical protein PKL00_05415 [Bacillota bacterium]|nr:hypothetical protein [Bacillota bacterium]
MKRSFAALRMTQKKLRMTLKVFCFKPGICVAFRYVFGRLMSRPYSFARNLLLDGTGLGGHKARPYNFTPEGLVGSGRGEEILRCAQDDTKKAQDDTKGILL